MSTLDYVCKHCGEIYVSPFPNPHYGTPDTCPPCWRKFNPQVSKPHELDEDQRRALNAERVRKQNALIRARRIAANIEAHPEALEKCVNGLMKELQMSDGRRERIGTVAPGASLERQR